MSNRRMGFPAQGETQEIVSYRDRMFTTQSTFRSQILQEIVEGLHYLAGHQWIEPDEDNLVDSVRGIFYKALGSSVDEYGIELPRPVTNYIKPAVELECSVLGKRQWMSNVITTSRDTRVEAAAKVAKDVLEFWLRQQSWPEKRNEFIRKFVTQGTGFLKTFWDDPLTKVTRISSPEAAMCPMCGHKFYSRTIPKAALKMDLSNTESIRDIITDVEGEQEQVELTHCPLCRGADPLQDYEPDEEEANSLVDFLGRPLGVDVPTGFPCIAVPSVTSMYLENSGIGVDPITCNIYGQKDPVSLDWVEDRYPDFVDKLQPVPPTEFMSEHPLLGNWEIIGRYSPTLDAGMFDDYVWRYEITRKPSRVYPEGRYILLLNDQVVVDEPLIKKIETEEGTLTVPRVQYHAARFEVKDGIFWGQPLPSFLISPQNRVNGLDAQVIEARERMGSPNLLVDNMMELQGPEFIQNYGMGKIFTFTRNPMAPTERPQAFGSILMPLGVYQERDRCVADMAKIAGPQEVELGEAPRNISTTSGLQILGENAERRRAERDQAIIACVESCFSHVLKMEWTLRSEPMDYELMREDGSWEKKQYKRQALMGQTKVRVEKQAYIDKSLYQREAAREAQADGLYDVTSPIAKKRLLELRGLPTNVNEDSNLQVDHAERQWVDFVDEGTLPVVDATLDDPFIHYQVLGAKMRATDGQDLMNKINWSGLVRLLAGWEERLNLLIAADQQARATYGVARGDQANEAYAKMTLSYQAAAQQFQMLSVQGGPSAAQPPQPPPPPIFLPDLLQDKIIHVWKSLIEERGGIEQVFTQGDVTQPLNPMETAKSIENFLSFRSAYEAYKLMGPPMAPSPGSGATQIPADKGSPITTFNSPPSPPEVPMNPSIKMTQ